MDIVHRVAKAVKDTSDLKHHDPEEIARAAVATMFNWFMDPSDRALDAAVIASHHDVQVCRRTWSAMLSEMRKEAGF